MKYALSINWTICVCYVAIGAYGTILTSNDGFTWKIETDYNDNKNDYRDVFWDGDMFAIVGEKGTVLTQNIGESVIVKVDNRQLTFDVMPESIDGRVIVPMRSIFEALGATVTWDGESNKVTATKDNNTIVLQIGSKLAKVNDQTKELDVAPVIKDGRTLVPVRFISESFGAKINWKASVNTVHIRTITN